jgi:hypothetical protein
MLSPAAIAKLAAMTYRPDAVRQINLIPLSGIYWADEYSTGDSASFAEDDLRQMLQMFGLRALQWRGEPLSEEQQKFWDDTHSRAPSWALFARMKISEEDLQADDFANKQMDEFEEALFAEADEVRIVDGNRSVSISLAKGTDPPF